MSAPIATVKTRVAAISIFASAGTAATKFVVGVAIGSLALISEALHSSVDLVATVITCLVVRMSDRPADEEHHYGHGKIESLSARQGVNFQDGVTDQAQRRHEPDQAHP